MTRLQLRCAPDQKERWEQAAGDAGSLSQWIRDTLDRAAEDVTHAKSVVEEGPDVRALTDEAPPAKTPDAATSADGPALTAREFFERVSHYFDAEFEEMWRRYTEDDVLDPEDVSAFRDWLAELVVARAVEEEPDGKALGEASDSGLDMTSAQVAPEGSSSTAEVPAPISNEAVDVVIGRLFPGETAEGLMHEYESTEHDFNNFLGWLVWRHERVESTRIVDEAVHGFSVTKNGERVDPASIEPSDGTPDHFEGNIGANIAGGRFPDDPDDEEYARYTGETDDPDDDTNPEPEDPDDLPAPAMLEADEAHLLARRVQALDSALAEVEHLPAPTHQLSPTCVNAAMHWRLTAGESCRYCGGAL